MFTQETSISMNQKKKHLSFFAQIIIIDKYFWPKTLLYILRGNTKTNSKAGFITKLFLKCVKIQICLMLK